MKTFFKLSYDLIVLDSNIQKKCSESLHREAEMARLLQNQQSNARKENDNRFLMFSLCESEKKRMTQPFLTTEKHPVSPPRIIKHLLKYCSAFFCWNQQKALITFGQRCRTRKAVYIRELFWPVRMINPSPLPSISPAEWMT